MKLHVSDKWFETTDSDNGFGLASVKILPRVDGMDTIVLGSQGPADWLNAKSALYAASSLLRLGRLDHPLTQIGLHLYADSNINSLVKNNLGIISVNFAGEGLPFPIPDANLYPDGWAQLNVLNRRFTLSHFQKVNGDNLDSNEDRARKADFVDLLLAGYGLDIRVLPWNLTKNADTGLGAADTVLAQFLEDDDEKAYQMYTDALNHFQARSKLNAPVRAWRREHPGEALPATKVPAADAPVATKDINGSIVLATVDGKHIDITRLTSQYVRVHDGRGNAQSVPWDGGLFARLRFQGVAKREERVELLNPDAKALEF